MKDNLNSLEIKYLNQRYNELEAWIRFKESDWIRLDAFLEYYLLKNVNIMKEYREKLGDKTVCKLYQDRLLKIFSKMTSNGKEFDFQKYLSWVNNPSEISKVINLLSDE